MKIDLKNKRTMTIIAICVILVILICIGLCFFASKNKQTKISKLYSKLQGASQYSFILKQGDGYIINMAKKDSNTSIDMESEDMHTTTLVKEGKAYFINHDEKLYSSYGEAAANENILFDELERIKEIDCKKGKEKINGSTYNYEEYTGYSGFMYSSNIDIEEENIKTKFYFKGDKLKYIKTIVGKENEELIEVELKYQADDALFEIPSNYQEM